MNREVYSFSSGPGMVPHEVLQTAHDELMDWHGIGLGVMEMSHRSPEFNSINDKTN
jgi:phosphoserine aminotransferase